MKNILSYEDYLTEEEKIKGGLADSRPDSDFDSEQLAKGIKVEYEHTNDKEIAKEIAKDHLAEDPDYYIKLATIDPHHESNITTTD